MSTSQSDPSIEDNAKRNESEVVRRSNESYAARGVGIVEAYRKAVDNYPMSDSMIIEELFMDLFHGYGAELELSSLFSYARSVYEHESRQKSRKEGDPV